MNNPHSRPLPPMHEGDITDIWDSAKNNTALRARLKALATYAAHHSGCAEYHGGGDDCVCGLADLVADLEREGLVP